MIYKNKTLNKRFNSMCLNRIFNFRSLFDYDPSTDDAAPGRKLGFRYGDIFQVISTGEEEDEWWQAKKVVPPENNVGFIPSKLRY